MRLNYNSHIAELIAEKAEELNCTAFEAIFELVDNGTFTDVEDVIEQLDEPTIELIKNEITTKTPQFLRPSLLKDETSNTIIGFFR